jgi:CHASE2 domain-containing sensor protein
MEAPGLQMFAALIIAWGVALIFIALRRGHDSTRSPTRRAAGAIGGLAFVLAGAALFVYGESMASKALAILAVVAIGVSWYLGRHAKKLDRAMR